MLKIVEVKSEEHFQQLRQQEDTKCDYLYICKHCNEIKLSDNGELKTIGTQNQNAFSAIAVETVENGIVEATDVTDTLVLAPGENVSIVPDNESNKVVITHQTDSGNKHIPSGGSEGQLLRWKEDGTAEWATIEATSAEKDGAGNNIVDTYARKDTVALNNATRKMVQIGSSGKGWYRIAKFVATSSTLSALADGEVSNSCDIILKRVYNTVNNESHEIKFLGVFQKSKFISCASISNNRLISKIRHVVDTTNKIAYIEIYYSVQSSTYTNGLSITINNSASSSLYGDYNWTILDTPEFTEETVDGLTVRSSLDIPENSSGTATYDENGNGIINTYASKNIYGDSTINLGRKASSTVGTNSVALGYNVTASGYCSHAEGESTTASGEGSHAEGCYTTALTNQHAQGHYNDTTLAKANSKSGTSDGTAFVIGNGTNSAKSNAFRVTGKGVTYAKGAYNSTGADYAEFAEWADGNPNNEDRRGYFVTFDEEKPTMIRKANAGEYILGIVSGNPCIIGNADEGWLGKYVFDEFGGIVYEDVEIEETYTDETGEEKTRTVKVNTYKINPEYDPTKEYIHREKRKEWAAVGWMGVLSVRDDGSCIAGGYCNVTDGGIATKADRGFDTYRVIKRVTDNIVKVVLK